nr:hypothetical protein [Alkalispirochaeta americana]
MFVTEQEQSAGKRILLHMLGGNHGQAIDLFSHISSAGPDEDLYPTQIRANHNDAIARTTAAISLSVAGRSSSALTPLVDETRRVRPVRAGVTVPSDTTDGALFSRSSVLFEYRRFQRSSELRATPFSAQKALRDIPLSRY